MLTYEWVAKVTQAATNIGMEVDDLSTNGVWWDSLEELEGRLRVLKDSGFGGGFHLSVDTFHAGAGGWRQAEFVRTAIGVFGTAGNLSCAETPRHPAMPAISRLARHLNAQVVEESAATGRLEVDDVAVPYFRFPIADVGQGCNGAVSIGEKWFEGFDCYGHDSMLLDPTGQAYFCLGFAAYLAAPLRLGDVAEDGLAAVISAAATNPLVGLLCAEGPAGLRRVIGEHEPHAFPHPWASPCAFCYHCLTDEGLLSVLRDEGILSEAEGS